MERIILERIVKMREILFRGKRKDGNEWVEGYYSIATICTISNTYLAPVIWKCPHGIYDTRHYEILPETRGMYTGLTDKNGKKIFEGDIVKDYFENQENEYDYDCFDSGRVFWNHSTSQFLRTSKWFPDDCAPLQEHREYEVIGNIHDNPELLESEE